MAIECATAHAKEGDNDYTRVLVLRLGVVQTILMRQAGSSASAREHSPSSFGLLMKHVAMSGLSIETDFHLIFEYVATSFFGDPQLLEISKFLVGKYYGGIPSAAEEAAAVRARLSSDAALGRHLVGASARTDRAGARTDRASAWTDRASAWTNRASAWTNRASAAARYEVLP